MSLVSASVTRTTLETNVASGEVLATINVIILWAVMVPQISNAFNVQRTHLETPLANVFAMYFGREQIAQRMQVRATRRESIAMVQERETVYIVASMQSSMTTINVDAATAGLVMIALRR